jgi:hypothetical protein
MTTTGDDRDLLSFCHVEIRVPASAIERRVVETDIRETADFVCADGDAALNVRHPVVIAGVPFRSAERIQVGPSKNAFWLTAVAAILALVISVISLVISVLA